MFQQGFNWPKWSVMHTGLSINYIPPYGMVHLLPDCFTVDVDDSESFWMLLDELKRNFWLMHCIHCTKNLSCVGHGIDKDTGFSVQTAVWDFWMTHLSIFHCIGISDHICRIHHVFTFDNRPCFLSQLADILFRYERVQLCCMCDFWWAIASNGVFFRKISINEAILTKAANVSPGISSLADT